MGLTDIIDAGGNMTVDGLRGASISYNILNLPEEVCLGNEKVSYIYTSAGEKLATRVGSSLTYYRGPLVYSGNNLLYLVHPEGLTRKSTSGFVYYYAKRDHLGSTRVLCHASGNTLVAVSYTHLSSPCWRGCSRVWIREGHSSIYQFNVKFRSRAIG